MTISNVAALAAILKTKKAFAAFSSGPTVLTITPGAGNVICIRFIGISNVAGSGNATLVIDDGDELLNLIETLSPSNPFDQALGLVNIVCDGAVTITLDGSTTFTAGDVYASYSEYPAA